MLSDQSRLALQHPGPDGPLVVTRRDPSGRVEAFAELSSVSMGWTLDVVAGEHFVEQNGMVEQLVSEAVGLLGGTRSTSIPRSPGGVSGPDTPGTGPEERLGFELQRELRQMGRELPTGMAVTIDTRSFVPGTDDRAFLDVNNRAFAGHHEQSNWELRYALHLRQAEPWFDPAGSPTPAKGRLVGFCWTKIHADGIGEIYVIAVDPDFTGLGLGKQLTLAGLEVARGARRRTRHAVRRRGRSRTRCRSTNASASPTAHTSRAYVRAVRVTDATRP